MLCHATALTASSLGIYWHSMRLRELLLQLILLLQHSSVLLVMHHIMFLLQLILLQVSTSCSLNCDLVMGSVTVTKTRARPAGNCAVDGPASIASDGVSCNSFGQHEAHVF